MKLEHVAIWCRDLEKMRSFYTEYFNATSNDKYRNPQTGFESYFLTFPRGARLEIMWRQDIPENRNDTIGQQHQGLIHMAFDAGTRENVDAMAEKFRADEIPVLRGPRLTGDGYYEFESCDPENNRIEVISTT